MNFELDIATCNLPVATPGVVTLNYRLLTRNLSVVTPSAVV